MCILGVLACYSKMAQNFLPSLKKITESTFKSEINMLGIFGPTLY